ncbi:MAG: c-type cytochrome [Candidatus Eremiobacteraeota bacterium]|nr:c-type cytochrome [Candidatus Eremiobacteraeota bacterium]
MTTVRAATGSDAETGKTLYAIHCSSCHGATLYGSVNAPSLRNVSRAALDFWLGTGRMPAHLPYAQDIHQRPIFSPAQIASLTEFVMSQSRGSTIMPHVDNTGDLVRGRTLFIMNCAACHGVTGSG